MYREYVWRVARAALEAKASIRRGRLTAVLGVAFALRGTLVDDRGLARAAVEKLVAEALVNGTRERYGVSPAAAADRILANGSATACDIGASAAEFVEISSGADAVRTFSARYRQISASLVPDFLIPRDGALDTICELSRLAIPAAVLTNAIGSVAVRAASMLGFAGRLLVADDIGVAKPAALAYATLVSMLGLPAEAIYYVSADPSDIAAADAAGLTTVYLDEAGTAPAGDAPAPDHTIESLSALLPILAAPYSRGALSLRYMFHSALAWRPGHFVPGAEYGRRPVETDD